MEDILEQNVMSYEKIFILNEMNLQIIFVATPSTWLGVVTGYRRGPCARRVRKSSSKKCDREGGDRRLVGEHDNVKVARKYTTLYAEENKHWWPKGINDLTLTEYIVRYI